MDFLYHEIEKEIEDLANCYDFRVISEYSKKQLTTMFLLDGCFLPYFICCFHNSEEGGLNGWNFTNHQIACIKQDLFLLENQLPFQVLRLLFRDADFPGESMEDMIEDFVTSNIPMPRGIVGILKIDVPCHLLHFLQGAFLGRLETMTPRQETAPTELMRERKSFRKGQERPIWHSCKNVQQLMAAGIRFKPSRTNRLTDISFTSYFGITGCLMLPPITMNTSTLIIFLNLIAFESSNATNQLGVISYLCFLDSLIDHWDDVKELQAARVLHNFVGDQREVAQFFNHVCGKLVPNPITYKEVQQQIQVHVERYYSSKVRMWLSQCRYTYFSSPWSIIALTGAILGLLLTAIQAYTSLFFRSTN
ncbi:hypothetical protein PVL29_010743 [Vitis rotundifolia]|uniref:Uncharacterized protein n=1 Tax=Vitis rotundifolia TaxID=103349 RepID=A0AA38ZW32_VITRO|nr:hypothetical protein PVL29_010743 [Vitis rotundifolia]